MLGDSLLVAPVFTQDGTVSYYLPKGKWTHLLTHAVVAGGQWLEEQYDFMSLPLYVKENTLLPIGVNQERPDYCYTDDLEIHVFELQDKAECKIYGLDGTEKLAIEGIREDNQFTFKFKGEAKNLKIILRNMSLIKNLAGGENISKKDEMIIKINQELENITFNI